MVSDELRHSLPAASPATPPEAGAPRSRVAVALLALALALGAVVGTAGAATAGAAPALQGPVQLGRASQAVAANTNLDQFDQEMLGLMNAARGAAGAPALAAAPRLRNLALSWSNRLASGATGGALQHNPDVRGQLPSFGAASATAWAENVAYWAPTTSQSPSSIFNSYMNSPGHRANILNPAMRFVGIGTVSNDANAAFNTQNFTNRVDAPVAVQGPIGSFDAATATGNSVYIAGWTLEPSNTAATTEAHIYINNAGYPLQTTTTRNDVNRVYGATGNHGFTATLPLPYGTNTICAYAVSTIGTGNTLLGCRTVMRS